MTHTDTLAPAPLVADDLSVVVADAVSSEPAALEIPQTVKDGVRRVVSHGITLCLALCMGLVVFLFAGTSMMHSRYQRSLRNEFRRNDLNGALPPLVITDSHGSASVAPIHTGAAVAILRIPSLGVDEVVSEGTRSGNTLRGPGHLTATPLPGQLGNAVVIGRRSTGGAPFEHLGSLHAGDHFSFVVAGGIVQYRVVAVGVRRASDISLFATQRAAGHPRNTATLVTTTSLLDADHLRVVVGELQGTPHGFTPGRVAPNREDLGLAPDRTALLPLAFALQLLLLASIGAVWLTKRWHRYAAWTVATPVVLACAWFAFEQFTRMLPAAL